MFTKLKVGKLLKNMKKIKFLLIFLLVGVFVNIAPVSAQTTNDLLTQIQALTVQLQALQDQINKISQSNVVAPSPVFAPPATNTSVSPFTQTLSFGMTNNDQIKKLQGFLIAKGFLQGTPNGSMYQTTTDAVKKFQAAYGIAQVGIVGPITRAKLNELWSSYDLGGGDRIKSDCLVITSPIANAKVTFPLTITGQIPVGCKWGVFEGEAGTVYVQDANGSGKSNQAILRVTNFSYNYPRVDPFNFTATITVLNSTPRTSQIYLHFLDTNPKGEGTSYYYLLPVSF